MLQHGINCPKAAHDNHGGYLHGEDDDSPYDVDGVKYCGRCHRAYDAEPFTEAVMGDDRTRGLYGKFYVRRYDGRDEPGQKHHGCQYLVLDLTDDPFAIPAAQEYANACEAEYPLLARDIRAMLAEDARRKEKADAD